MSETAPQGQIIEWNLHPPYGAQLRPTVDGGIRVTLHSSKIAETLQWFEEAVDYLKGVASGDIKPANYAFWEFQAKVALGLAKAEDAPELAVAKPKALPVVGILGHTPPPTVEQTALEKAISASKVATLTQINESVSKVEAPPTSKAVGPTIPPPAGVPEQLFVGTTPVGIAAVAEPVPTVQPAPASVESAESTLKTDVSSLLSPPPTNVRKVIETE